MMDFCWNSELNRWKNIPIIVTLAFITGACWRVSITRRNSTSLLIFLLIGVLLSACQDFTLNVLETTRTSLPVTQNVVAEPATQTPAQVTSTSPSDKSITIKGVKIQDHSYTGTIPPLKRSISPLTCKDRRRRALLDTTGIWSGVGTLTGGRISGNFSPEIYVNNV